MESLDKKILKSLYIANLSQQKPAAIFKKIGLEKEESISTKIYNLMKNGLIEPDKETITKEGRESLKIVLAGGVFDIIHPGHIHTLNAAKKLGDVLVVVIATDNTAVKMKKRKPLHSQDERKMLVDALEIVDIAIVGNDSNIFNTVDKIKPQIIALGYDQTHQEKSIVEGCKKINLKVDVARLQSPIPKVSSSIIEKEYGTEIHGI